MDSQGISVIIPTLAEQARFKAIQRCITSIRRSTSGSYLIIAVVNGERASPEVVGWLAEQADVRLIREWKPSAPNAIRIGREAVSTAFFSTIDDDDEYLPGSTDLKLEALLNDPEADLVITNGLRVRGSNSERLNENLSRVATDPLGALLEETWLHNCSAAYRTDRISSEYFQNFHPYAEWTWLAFKLAMSGKRIAVLDQICFRCNYTPDSLSQSTAYLDAYPELFERMLAYSPPARICTLIRRKQSALLHDRSVALLRSGRRRAAIAAHFRSLLLPGGLRYLTYSRRLLPGWPNS